MDLKLIQRLIGMMKRGAVAELELEDPGSGVKVRLVREGAPSAPASPVIHMMPGAGLPAAAPPAAQPGAAAVPAAAPGAPAPAAQGKPFPSPMVGTFYRAGSPEAEPFVQVGSRIGPDTVVCIIEAMKVMNEIKAETSGEILEILVENGEPVEFGQPLFLLKSS